MLMNAFKQVDLDSLPCPYIDLRIAENKRWDPHFHRVERLIGSRQWKTIGFAPEKLLDWRGLERRWFQLHSCWQTASNTLWDICKKLSQYSSDSGGSGVVWAPDPQGLTCDVYEPVKGTNELLTRTNVNAKELIMQAIPNPNLRPYVVGGEDLDLFHRYKRRIETMRRRSGPFHIAWRMSVEERLETYVQRPENWVPFGQRRYCNPCAFVFNNDDRAYLVTSDENGMLKWHATVVHIDKSL